MHILSVSEMRALESTANVAGHTYMKMMELAGQGVVRALLQRFPTKGRRFLVLVGPGNNGGDGLVTARLLQDAGAHVTAYLAQERDPTQDTVFKSAQDHGVTFILAKADTHGEELQRLILQTHVLIDALLGTGATPPLRGIVADIVQTARAALEQSKRSPLITLNPIGEATPSKPVIVAVDGPSGIDFDTGAADSLTLKAHLTITFAAPKWGHFLMPAAGTVGELIVADIGIPANMDIHNEGPEVTTPQLIREWLPNRPINAHKGTFGKAMIIAGSTNYTGAAALSAKAAVRAGAGLVTLAIPSVLHPAVAPQVPEATYLLLPHSIGVLAPEAVSLITECVEQYSALLIGPGLGNTSETQGFVQRLFALHLDKKRTGFLSNPSTEPLSRQFPPLVIDADGLNILSAIPDWHTLLPSKTILTPHPGEMARLAHHTPQEVQTDRVQLARKCAKAWGHIVVLKGAYTVVAAPNEQTMLIPFANPGLATAGTGDVLAGTIVALLAQGLSPFKAAVTGTYLHGIAGEVARRKFSTAGMSAGDVVEALAEAWRRLTGE
ncbi:MAG: NAD(P)H-hydrate dehydratase [Anaerolineae bacterium]|nr:NAD(P)H-hydrate dehydratase [Anaerolineae bacterium]